MSDDSMYDNGDWLPRGLSLITNRSASPERVWSEARWRRWSVAYIWANHPHIGNPSIGKRGDNVSRREWRIFRGITRKQLLHKGGKP